MGWYRLIWRWSHSDLLMSEWDSMDENIGSSIHGINMESILIHHRSINPAGMFILPFWSGGYHGFVDSSMGITDRVFRIILNEERQCVLFGSNTAWICGIVTIKKHENMCTRPWRVNWVFPRVATWALAAWLNHLLNLLNGCDLSLK